MSNGKRRPLELTYDEKPAEGPLIGIASGLRAVEAKCDAAFVVGCDVPFLEQSAVGWLADQLGEFDLVIPLTDGVLQPMAAIYRTSVLSEIDRLIAEGERSPRVLAERVKTRTLEESEIDAFDPDRRFLRNINTPEDYQQVLREVEQV